MPGDGVIIVVILRLMHDRSMVESCCSANVYFSGCMLHTIESRYGDIHDKMVADVGCGTGMLTVGSCLLGAQ